MLGLTDKEVAKNGPYYLPTFGKFHPLYTFYDVRPTLYVTHVGTQPARWLEHLTDGEYTRRYSTYRLHAVSHPTGVPGCGGTRSYVISVRKGEAELRLLPAVRELEPKEVTVPYRQKYVPWFKRG